MKKLCGLSVAQHLLLAAAAGTMFGSGCAADPDAVPEVVITGDDVIDDLEDADDGILNRGFRVGYWYGFNDETPGMQMPDPNNFMPAMPGAAKPGEANLYSARTWGGGFTKWGAGIGFDLNNAGDMANPNLPTNRKTYDASQYKDGGIVFRAKGTNQQIRFAIATSDVITVEWKGTCIHEEVEGKMCDDTHGKKVNISGAWRQFKIPFNEMVQEGFGPRIPLDLTKVMAFHFVVAENTTFDFYVDDIGFYK